MTIHLPNRDRRRFLPDSALAAVGFAGVAGPQTASASAAPQQRAARSTPGSKSLSRQFAEWVVRLRYEDLPADVVDRVKGLTLQNISSALLGAQLPAGQRAIAFITDEEAGIKDGATIMRFDEEQVHAVISLCTNLAGSNLERQALREGAAVRNAMLAVALAKQGQVGGGEAVLEGPAGFYHAYAGNNTGQLTYSFVGATQTSLDRLTADLGKSWMILETLYRIYSIAGYNIAHVDVTASLCEEHNIRYQDVDRVEAVVNWLETQYPSPAFPTRREDNVGDASPGIVP